MRKIVVCLLALHQIPATAFAVEPRPDPLQFTARIQNERLAEEAIDLLHCLAEGLNLPWELGEGERAPFRLTVQEKGGTLAGKFHSPTGEKDFSLASGEAGSVCETLLPSEISEAEPNPIPEEATSTPQNSSRWILGLAGAAVLVGGFFWWRASRRPDHSAVRMD